MAPAQESSGRGSTGTSPYSFLGALAGVPRVDVSADDDNFVGVRAPAQLANDIGGLCGRECFGLHGQFHDDVLFAGDKPGQQVRVFGA